jgi:chromosome segregation ATPase
MLRGLNHSKSFDADELNGDLENWLAALDERRALQPLQSTIEELGQSVTPLERKVAEEEAAIQQAETEVEEVSGTLRGETVTC